MIMIEPKEIDVGRKVVYRDRSGWKVEEGVITSFNNICVFVRYGDDTGSKGLDGKIWSGCIRHRSEADILPAEVITRALDEAIESWLDRRLWERRNRDIERARALL
jgi:hypothetical protein